MMSDVTRPWTPLLHGALQRRALRAVEAIARELSARATAPPPPDTPPPDTPSTHAPPPDAPSTGDVETAIGATLLHAYLARAYPEAYQAESYRRPLERAIDLVATLPMAPALFGGFTGVAWTLTHVLGPDAAPDDPAYEIDAALLTYTGRSPWVREYDLIRGLVGYGVYALERLPRPAAVQLLARVVDRLAELARPQEVGVAWFSSPALLPAHQRERYPAGLYDLGVAHGVPGVIAFLAAVCRAGYATARIHSLLRGAVEWLLAQYPPGAPAAFPAVVPVTGTAAPARTAWCYGEPGVAIALLHAARSAGRTDWERAAVLLARQAAQRSPAQAQVVDAGLCHGAAGLAHLFNRLFQATGDPVLRNAAIGWFAHTLAMQEPGQGIAGYRAWLPGPAMDFSWGADPGLLTGAAGVALALLAAATAVEPEWDRLLLVSTRPAPQVRPGERGLLGTQVRPADQVQPGEQAERARRETVEQVRT
jgi:hypothetical protein